MFYEFKKSQEYIFIAQKKKQIIWVGKIKK